MIDWMDSFLEWIIWVSCALAVLAWIAGFYWVVVA